MSIVEIIKEDIKNTLQSYDEFKNTKFLNDVTKINPDVFNTNKSVFGLNMELGNNLESNCGENHITQILIITHHIPPADVIDEDYLNNIGLKVIKLIADGLEYQTLFSYEDIKLEFINSVVGRMYDVLTDNKSKANSNAVIVKYNIRFNLDGVL